MRRDAVHIAKHQVGSLVGGKPSRESDREDVWVKHVAPGFDRVVALAAATALPAHAAAHELQEQVLQRVVRFPQLAGIDAVQLLPHFGFAHPPHPVRREVAVVELQHLPGEPTRHVNAVGDVADGNFLFHAPRPQVRPHPAADVPVQCAHGVGTARKLQADHRHAERFAFVVRLDAAEAHELLQRDTQLIAQRSKMFFDQAGVETVVPGRHRRVRGEDRVAAPLRAARRQS